MSNKPGISEEHLSYHQRIYSAGGRWKASPYVPGDLLEFVSHPQAGTMCRIEKVAE
jgi:hypothetical protein